MITQKLKFETIGGNAPVLTCNCCGKRGEAKGWLISPVYAYVNSSVEFSFVVCSDRCKESFIKHEGTEAYMLEAICRMSFDKESGGLNDEFKQIVDAYNETVN